MPNIEAQNAREQSFQAFCGVLSTSALTLTVNNTTCETCQGMVAIPSEIWYSKEVPKKSGKYLGERTHAQACAGGEMRI